MSRHYGANDSLHALVLHAEFFRLANFWTWTVAVKLAEPSGVASDKGRRLDCFI
jgi:hypothetical protein